MTSLLTCASVYRSLIRLITKTLLFLCRTQEYFPKATAASIFLAGNQALPRRKPRTIGRLMPMRETAWAWPHWWETPVSLHCATEASLSLPSPGHFELPFINSIVACCQKNSYHNSWLRNLFSVVQYKALVFPASWRWFAEYVRLIDYIISHACIIYSSTVKIWQRHPVSECDQNWWQSYWQS